MRPFDRKMALALIAFSAWSSASSAQERSVLVLVTDVWRSPIAGASVHEGNAPAADSTPIAESNDEGRCSVSVPAGTTVTIDHGQYAPLVLTVEQNDIERGYITAILYNGGAIQVRFTIGGTPVETDYALLRYSDPAVFGGIVQTKSSDGGSFRFRHMPEGIAYVTAGVNLGGALRTTTAAIRVVNEATNYLQLQLHSGTASLQGTVIAADGTVAYAKLSGTFIHGRDLEELRGETDGVGTFAFERLPAAPMTLRATLEDGSLKRTDLVTRNEVVLELDIRFDDGVTVTAEVEEVPQGTAWIDVYLLDGAISPQAISDPTDRATYLRGARYGRLQAMDTRIQVEGVLPGQYTILALATKLEDGRRVTRVSEFASLQVETIPVTSNVEFTSE